MSDFLRLSIPYNNLAILRPLTMFLPSIDSAGPIVSLLYPVNASPFSLFLCPQVRTVLSLDVLITLRSFAFFENTTFCTQLLWPLSNVTSEKDGSMSSLEE
jgi:hypothetical protein